jgi:hypothetical protein
MYKSTDKIKANVKLSWKHHLCKFNPGDRVCVDRSAGNESYSYCESNGTEVRKVVSKSIYSKPIQNRVGAKGNVVAVSCASDGLIRGYNKGSGRQFTRYYVQFNDGSIFGIHSHHLSLVYGIPVYDK